MYFHQVPVNPSPIRFKGGKGGDGDVDEMIRQQQLEMENMQIPMPDNPTKEAQATGRYAEIQQRKGKGKQARPLMTQNWAQPVLGKQGSLGL